MFCAQAVVTLLSMAAPVLFSILVLLQKEAPQWPIPARTCESARALLAEQLARLKDALPLSQPVPALIVCPHKLC